MYTSACPLASRTTWPPGILSAREGGGKQRAMGYSASSISNAASTARPCLVISEPAGHVASDQPSAFSLLTESYLDRHERQAMINTIGHLPWLKTHDLRGGPSPTAYALTPPPEATRHPFWVVQAAPDVINGHNGIFGDRFLNSLRIGCSNMSNILARRHQ